MAKPSDIDRALGAEITARRERAELTQRDVYTATGIPKNTYQRLEYGERAIYAAEICAIAELLNCRASDLISAAEARVSRGEIPSAGHRAARSVLGSLGYKP